MTRPRWRDIAQRRRIMIEVHKDLASGAAGIRRHRKRNPRGAHQLDHQRRGRDADGRHDHRPHARRRTIQPSSLEVGDTGIGMDEQTRKRCLEPFFSTKGKRGTGLGLAMVYGIMERHEGRIEIESEPGKGTTMRLVFPVAHAGSGARCRRGKNRLRSAPSAFCALMTNRPCAN